MQESAGECKRVQESAGDCRGVQGSAEMDRSVYKCVRICKSPQEKCAELYRKAQECAFCNFLKFRIHS